MNEFQKIVNNFYSNNKRHLPWRHGIKPYKILVSEIMLQQTQVTRVIPKFEAFIQKFPTTKALAQAPLSDVLKVWSGLGYNRRAKYLHGAATLIQENFDGQLPSNLKELVILPGVGYNTAAAIMNYAYNQPVAFTETNIRTVYLHHFFSDAKEVTDKQILSLVEETIDTVNPRQWFWALMDYGTFLKSTSGGLLHKSKTYKKQSKLQGSLRQMRGRIVKQLSLQPQTTQQLLVSCEADHRFEIALENLVGDGLIDQTLGRWHLTGEQAT